MLCSTVISYLLVFWKSDYFERPPFKAGLQDVHKTVRVLKQSNNSIENYQNSSWATVYRSRVSSPNNLSINQWVRDIELFWCNVCMHLLFLHITGWGHSNNELHHTRSYGSVIPCMGKFGIIPHHVVAATLHSKPNHGADFKAPSLRPLTLGRMQFCSLHFQRGMGLSRHITDGSTIHWN